LILLLLAEILFRLARTQADADSETALTDWGADVGRQAGPANVNEMMLLQTAIFTSVLRRRSPRFVGRNAGFCGSAGYRFPIRSVSGLFDP
jgi:hypothetical protein